MKIISFFISVFVCLTILVFLGQGTTGCSGGGGGGGTTQTGGVVPEGGGLIPASSLMGDELMTQDLLKSAYDELPQDLLTVNDRIEKDLINGIITPVLALELEVCAYYDNPCLPEQYKTPPLEETFDDSDFIPTLLGKLALLTSDEQSAVLGLWEAIVAANDASAPQAMVTKTITTKAAPSDSSPQGPADALAGTMRTKDFAGGCFKVARADPALAELLQITAKKDIQSSGVRFQLFFNDQDEASTFVANRIADAFASTNLVQKIKDQVTDTVPTAYDGGTECNAEGAYRIFLVPGKTYYNYHVLYRSAGVSYIVLNARDILKCRPTGFNRDSDTCTADADDKARGVLTSYWFRVVTSAFVGGTGFQCQDAIVIGASEWFGDISGAPTRPKWPTIWLKSQLYNSETSLCSWVGAKRFGSELFFWYMRDVKGGVGFLKDYLSLLKGGTNATDALKQVVGPDFNAHLQRFAESSLNLSGGYSNPQDEPMRLASFHPNYKPEFLSAGIFMPIEDFAGDVRMKVRVSKLPPLGIRYLLYANVGYGNEWNKFKKFTANWTGGFTAFGFKADSPVKGAQNYEVISVKRNDPNNPQDNVPNDCADQVNNQPDMWLLVFSNPTKAALSGSVTVETRAFCKDFTARIVEDYDSYRIDGNDKNREKYTATIEPTMLSAWDGDFMTTTPEFLAGGFFISYDIQKINDKIGFPVHTCNKGVPSFSWIYNVQETIEGGSCTKTTLGDSIGSKDLKSGDKICLEVYSSVYGVTDEIFIIYDVSEDHIMENVSWKPPSCSAGCIPPCTVHGATQIDILTFLPDIPDDEELTYTGGQTNVPINIDASADEGIKLTGSIPFPEPLETVSPLPTSADTLYLFFRKDRDGCSKLCGQLKAMVMDWYPPSPQ